MGVVDSPNGGGRQKKGRRGSKRIGFHLDMTPMVDVAFLLLTFFMLTTTFSKSNTMEINTPPEKTEVKVVEKNVLTLRIADDIMAYCSLGGALPRKVRMYDSGDSRQQSALSSELRQLLKQQTAANQKLVIVVKLSEKAKYRHLVDIIDELNLMKIERFSLDDYTDQDALEITRAI
ncbi:MAG: biopolymer transporter ExbD [Chlorobium sp.]